MGVKEKLKIKFKIKGSATKNGICFLINIQKTLPKEIAIKTYKNVHTGPKTQLGGDQVGLKSCAYQLVVLFIVFILKTYFLITEFLLYHNYF